MKDEQIKCKLCDRIIGITFSEIPEDTFLCCNMCLSHIKWIKRLILQGEVTDYERSERKINSSWFFRLIFKV